jgi:hypothetical protein
MPADINEGYNHVLLQYLLKRQKLHWQVNPISEKGFSTCSKTFMHANE